MSFRGHARKVRHLDLPLVWRHAAFRACLGSYCWLSHQKFGVLYARFAEQFGFDENVSDADERLLRALNELEMQREQLLERLRDFSAWRRREKKCGRREVSQTEKEYLTAICRGDEAAAAKSNMTRRIEAPEESDEKHPLTSWLGGCFTGCLLGAVGGPLAFLLLVFVLAWLTPDGDAEGSPFFFILSIPFGAIVGAVAFPIGRELVALLLAEIKYRSKRS